MEVFQSSFKDKLYIEYAGSPVTSFSIVRNFGKEANNASWSYAALYVSSNTKPRHLKYEEKIVKIVHNMIFMKNKTSHNYLQIIPPPQKILNIYRFKINTKKILHQVFILKTTIYTIRIIEQNITWDVWAACKCLVGSTDCCIWSSDASWIWWSARRRAAAACWGSRGAWAACAPPPTACWWGGTCAPCGCTTSGPSGRACAAAPAPCGSRSASNYARRRNLGRAETPRRGGGGIWRGTSSSWSWRSVGLRCRGRRVGTRKLLDGSSFCRNLWSCRSRRNTGVLSTRRPRCSPARAPFRRLQSDTRGPKTHNHVNIVNT